MVPQPQGGPPPPMLLRICPDDVDWFEFHAQPDQPPQVISAVFEHAKGDLAMTLYDSSGGIVQNADASTEEANGEGVALPPVEEPSSFKLKIEGKPLQENFYLLRIDQPQPQEQDNDEQQDEEEQDEEEQDEQEQDEQEEQEEQPQPQEDRPQPLEDALDKLDRNPQNLEARQRAQTSPLTNHPPEKDW